MSLFGSHQSIAGGHENAVKVAAEFGFDCVQLFSKTSTQWNAKPIDKASGERFRAALREYNISHPLVHDSYLINLASFKDDLFQKSIAAFADEMERCAILDVPAIVMHPGTPTDDEKTGKPKKIDRTDEGLTRIVRAFDTVFEQTRQTAPTVRVLLETTAGQGANLGWRFEHLKEIIDQSRFSDRFGVCFDTCHVFAAGYPLIKRAEYEATMNEFDNVIGLDRLMAFHLNDSVKGCGSRVDRHAHLGQGAMGLEPFRHLVNDKRFKNIPMYIETPKGETDEGVDWDVVNLETLRALVDGNKKTRGE